MYKHLKAFTVIVSTKQYINMFILTAKDPHPEQDYVTRSPTTGYGSDEKGPNRTGSRSPALYSTAMAS
jgi:hypothetical protein